jgi:hypothetical protein
LLFDGVGNEKRNSERERERRAEEKSIRWRRREVLKEEMGDETKLRGRGGRSREDKEMRKDGISGERDGRRERRGGRD